MSFDKKLHISISLLLLIWCFGFMFELLIPLNEKMIYPALFLKKAYSVVCHQDTDKLLQVGNSSLMVCARCTGIYIGALITSIVPLFVRISFRHFLKNNVALIIAAFFILFDVTASSIGLYNYSKTIAFVTGFVFGSVIIFYILESVKLFFSSKPIEN